MASKRKYAYYLRGSQIAIIEDGFGSGVCSLSGYSNQTTCEAAGGTWTENGISADNEEYRSPTASVTDGLEIEYAYSPRYRINDASEVHTITSYNEDDSGFLKFTASGGGLPTATITHIVISGSEKWNGLHKINRFIDGNNIVVNTKYNGSAATESFTLFDDVNALTDESDEIDLPEYLTKALVYYVKAKIAEDKMDIQAKEYFMTQFRA